jgi:hypothetical protein
LKASKSFVASLIAIEKLCLGLACALENVSPDIRADEEVVLASVRSRGTSLEHAATELKNDPTIALAAINQNAMAYKFVSASLKNDPDIIRAMLQSMGLSFDLSSIVSSGSSPMGNRDLMLMLAPLGSYVLEFASDEIKNDREVVLATVRADFKALRFASRELRNDPDIILAATAGDYNGVWGSWASDELLSNRDFALEVVSQSDEASSGLQLENFSDEVRSDPQVTLAAVQNGAYVAHCIVRPFDSEAQRELYDLLVKTAVSRDGDMLSYHFDFQSDRDVVMLAVTKGVRDCGARSCKTRGTHALSCASEELRADPEIVLAAVERNGKALEYASTNLRGDFGVVLTAVSQNADALLWASQDIKSGLPTQVKEQLNLHRCFVEVLLGMVPSAHSSVARFEERDAPEPKRRSNVPQGAEAAAPPTGCCFLQTLGNFDPETGTSIKKKIAAFVGIPRGAFLKKLRAAHENLANEK